MARKREWDRVIAHWERLASGNRRPSEGANSVDCAFCSRYWFRPGKFHCDGCPICIETGKQFCGETPYIEVASIIRHGSNMDSDKFKAAARKELAFLKKLRKKLGA